MQTTNNLFVDTAGWGYYLDSQDPRHPEFYAIVQRISTQRQQLFTTNYIITELVALLLNRAHLPLEQVIIAINGIRAEPALTIVYIDQSIDKEAWELLEHRLDKKWSLVDACSFVVMKRYRIVQALTTDHHFTQAGFMRVPAP